MNLLFIGPYRQSPDGWTNATLAYIKALATVPEINLAIRPIYFTNTSANVQDLVEYEYKILDKIDCVIQKSLPSFFVKLGDFKHVGLTVFETSNINRNWIAHCNLMDQLLVPHVRLSDINDFGSQIQSVGQPIDLSIFGKDYGKFPELDNEYFNFYFIGENSTRKNWLDLVLAFHTEFHPSEPVRLIIKTSGGHPSQTMKLIDDKITRLKERLRLYSIDKYKKDVLITHFLSENDLYKLHQSCDCFVMPSHGEAFCRPMVEAMGFGNQVLVTRNTGMASFCPPNCAIDSYPTPVECKDPPMEDIYTGREIWQKPYILDMRGKMREAYRKGKIKVEYDMAQFSYETVGKRIWEAIK